MKRRTECKKCRGTMYSDVEGWKCANCGTTEERKFRTSKKKSELSETLNWVLKCGSSHERIKS